MKIKTWYYICQGENTASPQLYIYLYLLLFTTQMKEIIRSHTHTHMIFTLFKRIY